MNKERQGRLKRPINPMPGFVRQALTRRGLMPAFKERPPYQQNDYVGWITRAKLEDTRARRLAQMLDELESGDSYMKMEYQAKGTRASEELQSIPGVGPNIEKDLKDLGFNRVSDLRGTDPEEMYDNLSALRGAHIDRCVLYVFRSAVYFAGNSIHDPELLKWWNWKETEMAELKTKPTKLSVEKFINSIEDEQKRQDSHKLLEIMKDITKAEPKMWGTSVVGFGDYHYKSASGREGDWFLTGFAPRKQNLTVYLMVYLDQDNELMKSLGKYKTGKSCLYIKRLADIDLVVLKKLIRKSVKEPMNSSA